MFQKVHFRMAILCGSITAVILLVMSFGYLYISERSLKTNSFVSFQNDMDNLVDSLEQQTVITHEWLKKMENNGKYGIQIKDNGVLFLYNEREEEGQKELFQRVWKFFEEEPALAAFSLSSEMHHVEFPFSWDGRPKKDYYVCIAGAERKGSVIQIMILASQDALASQIKMQRSLFFLLDILAVAALSFFAWHFTKKILKPLEENQKKQTQFIAAASHELRTPLAVILSCADALKSAAGAEREPFLHAVQTEGMRMAGLIDDMLLLTTADSHSWSIRLSPVELDTLLLEVFEAFQPMAAKKSIRLSVGLPQEAVPAVQCDQERIRQVMGILLDNAVNYTPEKGKISLSLACGDKHVSISVADNGIGIADWEKGHIFDRFYRAEKSRSQKGHFGLGLCIASEIMKAHHGRIAVSDTPGGGSTFTISLAAN